MSDTQIFAIGVFATILVALHVAVHIVQFRKLSQQEAETSKKPEVLPINRRQTGS